MVLYAPIGTLPHPYCVRVELTSLCSSTPPPPVMTGPLVRRRYRLLVTRTSACPCAPLLCLRRSAPRPRWSRAPEKVCGVFAGEVTRVCPWNAVCVCACVCAARSLLYLLGVVQLAGLTSSLLCCASHEGVLKNFGEKANLGVNASRTNVNERVLCFCYKTRLGKTFCH